MNPSRWNFFMKKLTRDRVVPTISASVSCEIFGTALSVWQMAITAGAHVGPSAVRDDVGQGGVVVRMPVGRIEEIADLRKREGHGAARHAFRGAVVTRRLRAWRGWRIDRICP